jgi:hypothetical protein
MLEALPQFVERLNVRGYVWGFEAKVFVEG